MTKEKFITELVPGDILLDEKELLIGTVLPSVSHFFPVQPIYKSHKIFEYSALIATLFDFSVRWDGLLTVLSDEDSYKKMVSKTNYVDFFAHLPTNYFPKPFFDGAHSSAVGILWQCWLLTDARETEEPTNFLNKYRVWTL